MTRCLILTAVVLVLVGCEQSIDAGNHCGPSTCGGCCLADQCELGSSVSACGQGGLACDACSGAQICSASGRCETPGAAGGGAGGGFGGELASQAVAPAAEVEPAQVVQEAVQELGAAACRVGAPRMSAAQ